jgi:hypothetical protein
MDLAGREACLLLLPVIINDGTQQVCEELVDLLMVGLTKAANDLTGPHMVQVRVGHSDFYPSPRVTSHLWEHVLYRQLPGLLLTATSTGDPALIEIATSMINIASAINNDLAVQEIRYTEAHNPSTLYEKNANRKADMLLLLTRSSDDDNLTEYYLDVTGRPKGLLEWIILQREVDTAADALNLIHFQVTPSQLIALKNFEFCGASYSKIGTGVLPFSITPAYATSKKGRAAIQADRNRAETFGTSGENVNGAMMMDDASRMRNYKGYVVYDWMEARL